jgi:hypothetical protein
MQQEFYEKTLYPLQDRVLRKIEEVNQLFYLSGGTALSRHYLQHRYSDDLDFFVNQSQAFQSEVLKNLTHLATSGFEVEVSVTDTHFVRCFVMEKAATLKLEWINDVAYSFGEKTNQKLFHRVDHWQNILSNKLSALGRNEVKDLADILFLCQKFSFDWPDVVSEAKQKDMWVEEIELSRLIMDARIESLKAIHWVEQPDFQQLLVLKERIAEDILEGRRNLA